MTTPEERGAIAFVVLVYRTQAKAIRLLAEAKHLTADQLREGLTIMVEKLETTAQAIEDGKVSSIEKKRVPPI